mmetsp:Transcript_1738/g.4490  ORF Transcript_1738/g.4490 Transcript_1738/m.4490 type:complete len:372 (-) Transcript_1738:876-1991(-)
MSASPPKTSRIAGLFTANNAAMRSSLAKSSSRLSRSLSAPSPAAAARSCSDRSRWSFLSSSSSSRHFASRSSAIVEDVASRCLSSNASRCWSSLVLSSPSARSDTAHVAISDDIASARRLRPSRRSDRTFAVSSLAARSLAAASAAAALSSSWALCLARSASLAVRSPASLPAIFSLTRLTASPVGSSSASASTAPLAASANSTGTGPRSGCLWMRSMRHDARSRRRRLCASDSAPSLVTARSSFSRLSVNVAISRPRSPDFRSDSCSTPFREDTCVANSSADFSSTSIGSVISYVPRFACLREFSATMASRLASSCPTFSESERSSWMSPPAEFTAALHSSIFPCSSFMREPSAVALSRASSCLSRSLDE